VGANDARLVAGSCIDDTSSNLMRNLPGPKPVELLILTEAFM